MPQCPKQRKTQFLAATTAQAPHREQKKLTPVSQGKGLFTCSGVPGEGFTLHSLSKPGA